MVAAALPIPPLSIHDVNPRSREARLRGLDMAWHRASGVVRRVATRSERFLAEASDACEQSKEYKQLSDQRLREELAEMRVLTRRTSLTRSQRVQAMAMLREASLRTLGLEPFQVQIAGALAMHRGCAVEMATGEGKTLTAALAAALAGWRGRGVHVVTVNDYLAARDAEWMKPLYAFAGISVDSIVQDLPPQNRRQAYLCDITYTTSKEVAADYLRDRLAMSRAGRSTTLAGALAEGVAFPHRVPAVERLVMRGLAEAIVDEADSLLIDEAVTPLIIAGDGNDAGRNQVFLEAADLAGSLAEGPDYTVDRKYREVRFTDMGRKRLAEIARNASSVFAGVRRREELVLQALNARCLHDLGKHYVIQEGKVMIVDEFTGRLMPDRTWRDGFHQAVEAKERIAVTSAKETLQSISFQRFFGMYKKLSGMSGTLKEVRSELWRVYHLPVTIIPRNKPLRRVTMPLQMFATSESRWKAVVESIKSMHAIGRPVLIGTRSVAASEYLSSLLTNENLSHRVLNAVRHKEEAEVISHAGTRGAITIATNMAGRGTDIKLAAGVEELGGLHVIGTELHEAERVDRQLAGRAGRQGEAGSSQFFCSLEDELLDRFAFSEAKWAKRAHPNRDAALPGVSSIVGRIAQYRAEALARQRRTDVLRSDESVSEALGFAGRD